MPRFIAVLEEHLRHHILLEAPNRAAAEKWAREQGVDFINDTGREQDGTERYKVVEIVDGSQYDAAVLVEVVVKGEK